MVGGELHLGLSPRDWAGVKQNCEEMRGLQAPLSSVSHCFPAADSPIQLFIHDNGLVSYKARAVHVIHYVHQLQLYINLNTEFLLERLHH